MVAKLYNDYITIVNNAFVASGEGVAGIYEGGRGTYRLADGRVMIGRFDNELPVGEGVCWIPPDAESPDPDRRYWRVARLLDGQPEAYISLEEAEVIAKNVGEPLPAFGTHLQTAI